ncbi:MAG: TolC family protein [Pirellulaceae bacterium]
MELNSAQSGIQQPTTFVVALAAALLLSHVATAQPTEETVGNALQYPLVETATSAGWTASDAGGLFIQDADQSVPDRVAEVTATIPQPLRNSDSSTRLNSYLDRANALEEVAFNPSDATRNREVIDFHPWWEPSVRSPIGIANELIPVDVGGLTVTALSSSPFVRSVLTEPEILQNDVIVENAAFDSLAFIEGKFADTDDPIGSALTTGNNSRRYRDDTFTSAAGIRKKSQSGGALELVQRGGFQSNNSTFLIPNPQGTTRLEVNFTQPLRRDRGRAVNLTRVLLAHLDVQMANAEVRQDLESHLTDVTRGYWTLYQARAEWLQRYRLYDRAAQLRDVLRARGAVDSHQRQILRAETAVASRRSDLVRIETRIRNAQAHLRTLTGDVRLKVASQWELIPQEPPLDTLIPVSQRDATITALDNRSDIAESIRKIQAITARVGAARNQVLPRLDMILHSHIAGLDANRNTLGAFGNQFADGRPSVAAGLLYESPFGNRAAQARLARNRLELNRAMYDFEQTTEAAFTDVEVSVRETQTSYAEMTVKKQAIAAAEREVAYLEQRWQLLPDPNESAVLLIEDLLDAQERLADEERAFVTAQLGYALSWVQLRKSMGVLLRLDDCQTSADATFQQLDAEASR